MQERIRGMLRDIGEEDREIERMGEVSERTSGAVLGSQASAYLEFRLVKILSAYSMCELESSLISKSAKAFLTECQQQEMFMSALVRGLPVLLQYTHIHESRGGSCIDTERYCQRVME